MIFSKLMVAFKHSYQPRYFFSYFCKMLLVFFNENSSGIRIPSLNWLWLEGSNNTSNNDNPRSRALCTHYKRTGGWSVNLASIGPQRTHLATPISVARSCMLRLPRHKLRRVACSWKIYPPRAVLRSARVNPASAANGFATLENAICSV
jgi:hypothetical protein